MVFGLFGVGVLLRVICVCGGFCDGLCDSPLDLKYLLTARTAVSISLGGS
jgi:hypothetical protein